ncbi:MAG TPA: 2-dehydropantoate 2-reductase [Candidatus Eisenbacteria bacterium]|nr:2-dehydropantoate 2-reductase [Candidatus Eisenbacteria bacterium]
MRVTVFGAGAIGSVIGARLHEQGISVTLIGRPAHVEAIKTRGLQLHTAAGLRIVHLNAATSFGGGPEVVLLSVKSQDVVETCRQITGNFSAATIVTMQNGVRCDDEAAGVVGRDRVVGCVLYMSATYLEPGIVEQLPGGRLEVGAPFPESRSRVEAVAELLADVLPTALVSDLAAARWAKLMGNLTNVIPTATGLSARQAFRHPLLSRLAVAAIREGVRTAQLSGQRLGQSRRARQLRMMTILPLALSHRLFAGGLARIFPRESTFGGSTQQSFLRGSSSELDYLNGEIVRAGRRIDRPTPINAALLERGQAVFTTRRLLTPEELAAGLPL